MNIENEQVVLIKSLSKNNKKIKILIWVYFTSAGLVLSSNWEDSSLLEIAITCLENPANLEQCLKVMPFFPIPPKNWTSTLLPWDFPTKMWEPNEPNIEKPINVLKIIKFLSFAQIWLKLVSGFLFMNEKICALKKIVIWISFWIKFANWNKNDWALER